ncbi:uncharacterized protein [Physcomitrium patens]|uniref:uncharacterized protein n=1 Tax=Physcomitrium patens TaxID=3218 RepID=UPI003CCCD8A4
MTNVLVIALCQIDGSCHPLIDALASSRHGFYASNKSRIPQAPWVLYFDGASRKPSAHGGLGVVIKNSKGQVVEEVREFLGGGISSGLAKYKALLAGLKKANSLQVKHLLVKGNSQLLINQVVGRWTIKDTHLRDHLKKVWAISKEFDSLLMEFISKDQNTHAGRIANEAIDKDLQIQEVMTEYFNRGMSNWPVAQFREPVLISPPSRVSTTLSTINPRPVSPDSQSDFDMKKDSPIAGSRPLSLFLQTLITRRKAHANSLQARVKSRLDDIQTSNSNVTRIIKNFSHKLKSDGFWNQDPDRLSIYDESSSTESEGQGCFETFTPEATGPVPSASAMVTSDENNESDEGEDVDSDFSKLSLDSPPLQCTTSSSRIADAVAADLCAVQLSEADYDRLVSAVIDRLKKT